MASVGVRDQRPKWTAKETLYWHVAYYHFLMSLYVDLKREESKRLIQWVQLDDLKATGLMSCCQIGIRDQGFELKLNLYYRFFAFLVVKIKPKNQESIISKMKTSSIN